MKLLTHGLNHGLNDLYILPESAAETATIWRFLKDKNVSYRTTYANVEGHDWYGKNFIDVPFGEYLWEELEQLARNEILINKEGKK